MFTWSGRHKNVVTMGTYFMYTSTQVRREGTYNGSERELDVTHDIDWDICTSIQMYAYYEPTCD